MTHLTPEFAARWEEYKRAVMHQSRPGAGLLVFSILFLVIGVVGQILGNPKMIWVTGLAILGLIYSQTAKFSIWSIVLDSLMAILVALVCVSISFADSLRNIRSPVLVIALVILELYLVVRVILQIRFRTRSIESRVVGDEHYPIVSGSDAFEWFAKEERRAASLISASDWPQFAKYILPNIQKQAQYFCEVCNAKLRLTSPDQMMKCSRCPEPARVLVTYDKPLPGTNDEDEWRVPCRNCGVMILRATAGKYDGQCANCPPVPMTFPL